MPSYPATYIDARGKEATTIFNDGDTLRMTLRGVEFSSDWLDDFEPAAGTTEEQRGQFTLLDGILCSYNLEFEMPLPVMAQGELISGVLEIHLRVGNPRDNGSVDELSFCLILRFGGLEFTSPGQSAWVEDELNALQKQLPPNTFMKACINCLYSDYGPGGNSAFGAMMCFRNLKAEYLQVHSKGDIWKVIPRRDRYVQETYLCPEFERRVPGTGFRG